MKGTAADILVKYLEQEGVRYLFGVPGGHLLPLYDAIYRSGQIKPILTKHEAGASYMGCGYAQVGNRIAVCCGTVGPGATNLVSGVAAAYMDSIPMLVLTAQVGTTIIGKGALQEAAGRGRTINQVGLLSNVCKYSVTEFKPSNLPATLRHALRIAFEGRPGPVHLDLPRDVLQGEVEADIWSVQTYRGTSQASVDPNLVARMIYYLREAEKPLILAGGGVIWSGAAPEVVALAERLRIPVITSLRGKGTISEDHPLALGCVGFYGTDAAIGYLHSGFDVLLAVGCSFHECTTHSWDQIFGPSRALLQIDIDPSEIGKNYPATVGVVGDAKAILQEMLAQLGEVGTARQERDLDTLKQSTGYFDEPAMYSDASPVKPQRLMKELRDILPEDAIVLGDIGNSLTWVERYFKATARNMFLFPTGLAAMGSATAAAIGAKLAAPERHVVCVCGDGDFQMTGMEVITAVNYDIPVIWIILNNSRLGMIYDVQTLDFGNRYIASSFKNPDFAALGKAFGAEGFRVQHPREIAPVIKAALNSKRPCVVDVPIDVNELPPYEPRLAAFRRAAGLPE